MNKLDKVSNVADFLPLARARYGTAQALVDGSRTFSFDKLDRWANGYAEQLGNFGFEPGDRVLMLVKNSAEFVALTFALFKVGCQPVLLDPGMGLPAFLRNVREFAPDGLVGVPRGFWLRRLAPGYFRSVKKAAVLGRFAGVPELCERYLEEFDAHRPQPDDPAAILFTSGSTGPAKGVVYRHRIFAAQVEQLGRLYGFQPGEVDLPGFPLFALFSTALGVCCVIAPLNPSRPARVNPAAMVTAIHKHGVTSLQGSPAIWKRVADYCLARQIQLPTVRRLLTFGAPISLELIRDWHQIMAEDGEVHTPYGATEALPVSTISGRAALQTGPARLAGAGICVGHPTEDIELRILPLTDHAIADLEQVQELPRGGIGEVAVRGEVVTWSYAQQPEATRLAKIGKPPDLYHRMGDMGYLDEQGKLWLVGRKSHRVELGDKLFCPVAAEGMVNSHPEVLRSALVKAKGLPVLVVERRPESRSRPSALTAQLLGLLERHPLYAQVRTVLFRKNFPVDPRHNAKIHRQELARWAEKRVK